MEKMSTQRKCIAEKDGETPGDLPEYPPVNRVTSNVLFAGVHSARHLTACSVMPMRPCRDSL
jgi:hypothetical protein